MLNQNDGSGQIIDTCQIANLFTQVMKY